MDEERRSRVRGSLIGGAIGDALGAPVEFLTLDQIRRRHGPAGVTGFLPAYGRGEGAITDDTQMTLFSAEGLLRALVRDTHYGVVDVVDVVHRAYLRWYVTQGASWPEGAAHGPVLNGWLFAVDALHSPRAPGNTCMSSLRSGTRGTVDAPTNRSKGCGAVMRSAPFGLIGRTPPDAFDLAVRCGAITHGNPSAYLPAGALAAIVASMSTGTPLRDALDVALELLRDRPGHLETLVAIGRARDAASLGPASAEELEMLGAGWEGYEALAIALYCALVTDDPMAALLLAVNHTGDTDSTGSIVGNIVGVAAGESAFPESLVAELELVDVIRQVADDLVAGFFDGAAGSEHGPMTAEIEAFIARYPGG